MKYLISYFDLFDNVPYVKRLSVRGFKFCFVTVILIAWLPMAVLSLFHRPESFFFDPSICIRFFLSLPLLLFSPLISRNKIRGIVNHFVDADIVREDDRKKFFSYIESTMRFRDSRMAKIFIWCVIYGAMIFFVSESTSLLVSTWRVNVIESKPSLSLAGYWYTFVAQPIYSFVQLYFLFRVLLWWRFMFLVSRLDLQLRAPHGDDSGGLIFLGGFLRIFNLPVLAFSFSIAAGTISLVHYNHFSIEELKFTVFALLIFCFLLFVAPLLFFVRPLLKIKQRAILNYGKLAGQQLEQFETKWLNQSNQTLGTSLLESGDFSAVTDALSIVSKVNKMRTIPFTAELLMGFVICIIMPFLPVLALKIPWTDILKKILGLII